MPKISVIVPVYNTEQFLPRCIDSILNQSFADFELLLIDDGSTDGSGELCDAYVEKDSRVQVFHKKNGGASSARNIGIDRAEGVFLTFVDSDDLVDESYLEHLMSCDSDMVITGLQHFSGDRVDIKAPKSAKYVRMSEMSSHWNLPKMNYLYCYPVAKRYRKAIVKSNNIRFDESLFYQEDLCFVLSYMKHIDGFVELPYADYEYWVTETYREGKFKMNASQLITHYETLNSLFDQMELYCKGKFNYVRDNVNLRLFRAFYVFLQDCPSLKEYKNNSRLLYKQSWSGQLLSLLKGKKEKRVLKGACYCPGLSFLVENRFRH